MRRQAVGLTVCLLAGAGSAWAVHMPPPADTVEQVTIEPELTPISAGWVETSLSPEPLITQRDIDLLLDLQLSTMDLGPTLVDPASTLPQQAAVDVRSLSPDVPANPLFPGYGLSFVQSSQSQRPVSTEGGEAGPDEPGPRRKGLVQSAAALLGLESHQTDAVADLRSLRQWLSQYRVPLAGGLGLLLLLALGVASLAGRSQSRTPDGATARIPPRRRRRRRGTHRPSSHPH